MVLSETPYLHVEYYAAHDVIVSQWYGRCTSQEYRGALSRFLHFVASMGIKHAIADRRLLPPLPPEDAQWTVNEYREEFRKLSLKRFAIINSFDPAASEQLQHFLFNKRAPFP